MGNTFKHRGFILNEGKSYNWSGSQEGLYNDTSWNKIKCKVEKIEDGKIHLKQSVFGSLKSLKGSPDEVMGFTGEQLEKFNVNFY